MKTLRLQELVTLPIGIIVGVFFTTPGYVPGADQEVSFNYDIRPIMSDTCFLCHGPDETNREADLRLDIRNLAIANRDGSPAIVPGNPDESLLIWMIEAEEEEDRMPPKKHPRHLTEHEKGLFRKWIEQGAKYEKHWSFLSPKILAAPRVKKRSWVRNDIDAFVLKRLEDEKLEPAKDADKTTLLRRVTFDLTGLPPTLEEIDTFLADNRPYAFERVVNDLLSRVTYAERMTNEWMDVARFSDSHGYSQDFVRDMSPYRDWVIESFHENMPFNQFVEWQLAGDLLPDATSTQKLATGFLRLHPQNGEGGIVNEEFKVEYAAERVQTIGAAFLGMTMECSRCHDHKYDPITQKNFYELFSFFNNIDDSGQISYEPGDMPVPSLMLPTDRETEMLKILDKRISRTNLELSRMVSISEGPFREWKKQNGDSHLSFTGDDALVAHFPLVPEDSAETIANMVDPEKSGIVMYGAALKNDGGPPLEHLFYEFGTGVKLNGDDPLYFPAVNFFRRGLPFSVTIKAKIPEVVEEGALFHFNKAGILYNYKGFEVSILNNHWDVRMAHTYPYNSIQLVSEMPVRKEVWQNIALTYDGSSKAGGITLYVNGEAVSMEVRRDRLYKNILSNKPSVQEEIGLKVGARWRSKGLPGAVVDEIKVFDRRLTDIEVAHSAGNAPRNISYQQEYEYYLNRHNEDFRVLLQKLAALRTEQNDLNETVQEVMVMDEMPEPQPAFVLNRGVYSEKKEPVVPDVPSVILPFPRGIPKNRLGLSQWITDPYNPLAARVTVNRYWQMLFGRGIVGTPEDFGNQGHLPTHPDLLDWLSRNFIDSSWDVKHLLKTIATSSAYRQSSKASSLLMEKDPENLLLARGPAKRKSAEMLRDNALAASGLLVEKIGGKSVYPYQSKGLWSLNKGEYIQGSGEDLYRRSLYTIWKRTVPPPTMKIFDAPNRSYCIVRRQHTSSPLQALSLMNNPQFVEAARALAERIMLNKKNCNDRLILAYRLLTSQTPEEKELNILRSLLAELTASYTDKPENSDALLSVGESSYDQSLNKSILAAYTMVVSMIMNHDAAVTLR